MSDIIIKSGLRIDETINKHQGGIMKKVNDNVKHITDIVGVTVGENHTATGVYDSYIKLMPVPLPIIGVVSNTVVFKLPDWLTETKGDESSYTLTHAELVKLKAYRLIDWQQNHNLVEIDKTKLRDGWLKQSKFLLISSEGEVVGTMVADCSVERSLGGPSYPV